MTETEKALFHVALGAAIFIVGFQLGLKRQAQQTATSAAATPEPLTDWLTAFGGFR